MTEHVAPGSAIWWELGLDDPYTTTTTRGALHGSAELDASGQLELSHVFQTNNDSNASLHFYSDAAKTQLLTQTPTITIRDLNLRSSKRAFPGSTSLAEGSPTTFPRNSPLSSLMRTALVAHPDEPIQTISGATTEFHQH